MPDLNHQEDLEEDPDMETDLDEGFESLSDEEFLNQGPASYTQTSAEEEPAQSEEDGDQPADDETAAGSDDHTTPQHTEAPGTREADGADGVGDEANEGAKDPATGSADAPDKAPDYESLYKQMMAPFKANGKEFAPSSPEEVIRLAQMGANYTKKMQALKPNLQLMRMLENNGLLEESKLSHLIDIAKGNPAAIQKLLHDTKVDPLDLDTSAEPNYTPGNHRVSDAEMHFQDVLTDVAASETGKDTILHIERTWDTASKQLLVKEPATLATINEHRSNGVYAKITNEIERQQTLGLIPSTVPFIEAYLAVGQRLQAEGRLAANPASPAQPAANPGTVAVPRQILETRAAKPRQVVSNGDRAKAASPGPRALSRSPQRSFDPFAMTDEEIMAIPAPPMR